jgi:hypothetical protein
MTERQVPLAHRVLQALMVKTEQTAQLVRKELLAHKVLLVRKVQKATPARPEQTALTAKTAHKVQWVFQAYQV